MKCEEINRISIKGLGEKKNNKSPPQKKTPPTKNQILMNPEKLFNHFLPILRNKQDNAFLHIKTPFRHFLSQRTCATVFEVKCCFSSDSYNVSMLTHK